MPEKLLPCPFCGGSAKVMGYSGNIYAVHCNECQSMTGKYPNLEGALQAWDNRYSPYEPMKITMRYAVNEMENKERRENA